MSTGTGWSAACLFFVLLGFSGVCHAQEGRPEDASGEPSTSTWDVDAKDVQRAGKRVRTRVPASEPWYEWEWALVQAQRVAGERTANADRDSRLEAVALYCFAAEGAAEVGQLWTVWRVADLLVDEFRLEPAVALAVLKRAFARFWKSGKFVHKGFKMYGHKEAKEFWSPQAHFTAALMMADVFARCGMGDELARAVRYADLQLATLSGNKKLARRASKVVPAYHIGDMAWRNASAQLRHFLAETLPRHGTVECSYEPEWAAPEDAEPVDWDRLRPEVALLGKSAPQGHWQAVCREHTIRGTFLFGSAKDPADYFWRPDAEQLLRLGFKKGEPFVISNHGWIKVSAEPHVADFRADDAGLVLLGGIPLACSWQPSVRWDRGFHSRFRTLGGFLPLDAYAYEKGGWNNSGQWFGLECVWRPDGPWQPRDINAQYPLAKDVEIRLGPLLEKLVDK